ncbi:ribonuclease D [Parvularcula marina]|uniref:Ribonuclease D n=1 Tax=Parvularcula marina TaxID=2292771 RepID=A0A371RF02_9PROT|nr:ribonuclease D [Parvularcula marina]RFB04010.1 ribonuclease D [Parvularcula marina]
MQVITKTAALSEFCARLRQHEFITVDTEFMREKTYYSMLCLIQVASKDEAAIIDPLSDELDLAPLLEIMADRSILKVFHAARQDLEIFYELMKEVPGPLFDTQIAAMACGHGDQVGYESLIREVTGEQVDKGSRFTDWSKRPLSDKQLTYALGDVTHLVDAYEALVKELKDAGRMAWIEEEMKVLDEPTLYFTAPETAWQRLKTRNLRPRELDTLKHVAAWREREAISRNQPRSRILKDDGLFEVARAAPDTPQALGQLRAIPSGFERSRAAASLLEAIKAAKALPEEERSQREKRTHRQPAPVDVLDLLRVLLKRQSEQNGIAPKMLASAADLEAIALEDNADVPAMKGWRREVFGNIALRLKHGELALALKGKKVILIETDQLG